MLRYGKLIPRFRHLYGAPEGVGIGKSRDSAAANLLNKLNKVYHGESFADGIVYANETRAGWEARARLLDGQYAEHFSVHDHLCRLGIEPHILVLDPLNHGDGLASLLQKLEVYVVESASNTTQAKQLLALEEDMLRRTPQRKTRRSCPLVLVASDELGHTFAKYHMRDFREIGTNAVIVFGHYLSSFDAEHYERLGATRALSINPTISPTKYLATEIGKVCTKF